MGGGGGGGTHNPGLISMGNDPGWPGSSALGHVRVLGAWDDYGGTGGYDLSVEFHDESGQRNEQAQVQGITMGTVEVNAGEILSQDLSGQTVYVSVSTHMGGGGGTSDYDFTGLCYITVIIQIGSFYSIETHYIDCEEARDMLKGPVPSSAKDCGGGGPGGPVGIKVTKPAHLVIEMLDLETFTLEYGWVVQAANAGKVAELKAFLDLHKVAPLEVTPKARAFGTQALHAWMEGHTVINIAPLIKYPKNSNYETLYPKLTEYLKNQLPNVAHIPKITNAIHQFTQLPLNQIQHELQWGEGPMVRIIQLNNYQPGETDANTAGYFDKSTPNNVYLDIDYVNSVELETSDPDALIFWIGTTVLHEYVHYGNYATGFQFPGEDGRLFEIDVYGLNVQPDTARMVLDRLN